MVGGLARRGAYRVLTVVGRRGTRFALDDEVRPVTSETGAVSFALNEAGVRIGDVRLVWDTDQFDYTRMHDMLTNGRRHDYWSSVITTTPATAATRPQPDRCPDVRCRDPSR
jgi:hypothetical protein